MTVALLLVFREGDHRAVSLTSAVINFPNEHAAQEAAIKLRRQYEYKVQITLIENVL